MAIRFSSRTDTGRVREGNEDNFLVDRKLQLYVVCDGMGGHRCGEVASAMAVNAIRDSIIEHIDKLALAAASIPAERDAIGCELVETAVARANFRIYERAAMNPDQRGMGTTCTMLLAIGDRGYVGHVGDSRLYRARGGHIEQVTEDHSLYQEMLRAGQTMPTGQELAALQNAITRALGVHDSVQVDTAIVPMLPSDRYLLCSDGLSGYLAPGDLGALMPGEDLDAVTKQLIDHANNQGGRDNITALLIEIPDDIATAEMAFDRVVDEALWQATALATLPDHILRWLDLRMTQRELSDEEVLVTPGDDVSTWWVVAEGTLVVPASDVTIEAGHGLFEHALLGRTTAPTALVSIGDSRVRGLTADTLDELAQTDPGVAYLVLGYLARRAAARSVTEARSQDSPHLLFRAPHEDALPPRAEDASVRIRAATARMAPPTRPNPESLAMAVTTTQDLDPEEILLIDTEPPPLVATTESSEESK